MSITIAVAVGVLLYTILMLLKYPILNSYNISDEVFAYADEYYTYNMLMALAVPIYYSFYYLVLYDGDEISSLISDIAMAIVTMAGPYILVGTFGIKGISITTPLSYIGATIPSIVHLFLKRNSIHFKFKFMLDEFIESIKCSSSVSFVTFYIAVVDIAFNALIVKEYGDIYLPSYAVTNLILNLANCLVVTMTAGGVFISCNFGENNPYAIKRVFKHCLKHGAILSFIFMIVLIALSGNVPGLYGIEDPLVFETAKFASIIIPISYIGYMLCLNFMSYYSMTNNIVLGNIISLLYMLIVPLVVVYPLGKYVGFNAMNIGFALTPFISMLILFVIFRFSKNRKAAPLFLPVSDEDEYHYDVELNKENIVELRDKIINDLKDRNIDNSIVTEVGVVVEDVLMQNIKKQQKEGN